jgi:hypothetical protein
LGGPGGSRCGGSEGKAIGVGTSLGTASTAGAANGSTTVGGSRVRVTPTGVTSAVASTAGSTPSGGLASSAIPWPGASSSQPRSANVPIIRICRTSCKTRNRNAPLRERRRKAWPSSRERVNGKARPLRSTLPAQQPIQPLHGVRRDPERAWRKPSQMSPPQRASCRLGVCQRARYRVPAVTN